jgi:hypothetical protein
MNAPLLTRLARRILRFGLPAGIAVLLFVPVRALVLPQTAVPGAVRIAADGPVLPGHPKIQSSLTRLLEIERTQGAEAAAAYARQRKMDWRDGRVRVVTLAENIGGLQTAALTTAAIRQRVEALGGVVETTYRRLVQHTIPPAALETLADDPLIKYVRLPLKPFPQAVVSEGVAITGADLWKNLEAFRVADPAKVCILDVGFDGYQNLLGSDLPKTVTTRSFRWDGDINGGGEQHGAACAEIVYDMAPNAKMYLVNIETDVEQHQAVDWIVSQGVDVISYSLGWFNSGAGDGTGPIDDDVEYAASQGLAWASSAGNSAQDHWTGKFYDPDGNGYMNFDSTGTEILTFHVPAYETVGAFLNWKDWGPYNGYDYRGSDQDYDFELYFLDGATWQFVYSSTDFQTGTQWPTEDIYGWYARIKGTWGVKIKKISVTPAKANIDLEIFVMGNDEALQYYNSARSVLVPADSPSAWAAGATDAGVGGLGPTDSLHYYSGRGPTWDGRMKPDFTAPSGVSTTTYGNNNFYGTSASAPHLAGAIALLKGMTPYSIAQIKTILIKRALDLGVPGPDNLYGYGRISVKK